MNLLSFNSYVLHTTYAISAVTLNVEKLMITAVEKYMIFKLRVF